MKQSENVKSNGEKTTTSGKIIISYFGGINIIFVNFRKKQINPLKAINVNKTTGGRERETER